MSLKYTHHAPDLLARVPADLLRQLRAHGPQPKTFRAGDIVMPDPACARPKSRHQLADYVLAQDQETVGCSPSTWVPLRGYEVLPGGRLTTRQTEIDWPVLVIGHHDPESIEGLQVRRRTGAPPKQYGPLKQDATCGTWWAGMRMVYYQTEEDRPIEVGDVVQSIAGKHLRRLWKIVQVDDGQGRLVGRRVSWKTGEVQPGRAHPITVDVVRLVPRETGQEVWNERRPTRVLRKTGRWQQPHCRGTPSILAIRSAPTG